MVTKYNTVIEIITKNCNISSYFELYQKEMIVSFDKQIRTVIR